LDARRVKKGGVRADKKTALERNVSIGIIVNNIEKLDAWDRSPLFKLE